MVELKSKASAAHTAVLATGGDAASGLQDGGPHRDAVAALVALGYKAADADQAVRHAVLALGPKATTEALIKKALS